MCGIVGVVRYDGKNAAKMTLKKYRAQKERGQEGYGYVLARGMRLKSYRRFTTEAQAERALHAEAGDIIVFHHRQPTSTPNLSCCAHPIEVKAGQGGLKHTHYVVHNGIISNDDELHEKHLKLGFTYTTEVEEGYRGKDGKWILTREAWNDSESLAIEVALNIEAGTNAVKARGSIAFLDLETDEGKVLKLHAGRNSSCPLKVERVREAMIISSQNGGVEIETNVLISYDLVNGKVDNRPFTLKGYQTEYPPYGYQKGVWDGYEVDPIVGDPKRQSLLPAGTLIEQAYNEGWELDKSGLYVLRNTRGKRIKTAKSIHEIFHGRKTPEKINRAWAQIDELEADKKDVQGRLQVAATRGDELEIVRCQNELAAIDAELDAQQEIVLGEF